MLATLRRLGRDRAGGAMAEYGILLALASGAQWLERVGSEVTNDPIKLWSAVAVVVVLIGYLVSPKR